MNVYNIISRSAKLCRKCSTLPFKREQIISSCGWQRSFNTTSKAEIFNLFKSKSNDPKNFGKYSIVQPGTVAASHPVPEHILLPPYAKTMQPPKAPKHIEIHSDESTRAIICACKLARNVLNWVSTKLTVGMTTEDIDKLVHEKIIVNGAYPSPLNYMGFPKSVCTSVNNVACHGIPDNRPLEDGDIINIDITVYLRGYHGDCSETYLIGNVDEKGRELVNATKEALDEAIKICGHYVSFRSIGVAVENVARKYGLNVVPAFAGHGIGTYFHGPPDIYHCQNQFLGNMKTGMIFTIEPILSQGTHEVEILEDGWTAVTLDNSRTAQFEHTILVTPDGARRLTALDD